MDIREIRKRRLQQLILLRFGGVMARLAEKINRQSSYVARVLSDNSEHSRNIGEKLAREIEVACELEPGYLDMPFDFKRYPSQPSSDNTNLADSIEPPRMLSSKIDSYKDTLVVPILDVAASMGSGSEPPDANRVVNSMSIQSSWVRQNLTVSEAGNLRLIIGVGDSMSPSFTHGDLLMVDTGFESVSYDGVYVFSMAGQLHIKRIQRELDGLRIISDNTLYREMLIPHDRDGEISIHGRVVFCWHGSHL
ncbi:S24 family peptidase [Pseudomonas sp. Fl4BN1]|uniref:S24 family peptidase n=1 Tax=Pseudomonas sp. Fl4BN1 TaxID=2697651 RepID=UPI00137905DC|nr:S24 family peptidase [Pseudomonas sp. Fl4BN1]NBF13058.1 hypothetical protein [Pseudomonas sp. Fl4BN1]